jgi:hypothetical protein
MQTPPTPTPLLTYEYVKHITPEEDVAEAYLNQMGADGWELCACWAMGLSAGMVNGYVTLLFKRTRNDSRMVTEINSRLKGA